MFRDRFVWSLTLAYALLLTLLGAIRYSIHRNLIDFGIFAQTIASAFGCFCNTIEGSHWAYHFSPILYAVGAAVAVAHVPLALIAIQAAACALVIPPIAAIVARRAESSIARLAAIVVFLYPALAGLTFGDFHENGFAPAAAAWLLWAFDGEHFFATIVFTLVALSVKEDQAIFLTVGGALGAWRFRGTARARVAIAVAALAASVGVAFFGFIEPSFAQHWSPMRFYAWSSGDLVALFPLGILQRLGFFVLAFAPLAFLPFRSEMMWLAAAPLAEVLVSRESTTFTMGSHYAGAWIGYVLVAFAFTLRAIAVPRAAALLRWCAAICVLELLVADPLHPGLNLGFPQARDRVLDAVLARLPRDAAVASQEEAFTHLALFDPNATLMPEFPQDDVCTALVLVDTSYPDSARLQEFGPGLARLVREGAYAVVSRDGGVEIYRRVRPCR